jgi:hypothetical protein
MLYKISQIFCQYIMADFPVPSLPRVPVCCSVSMQFHGCFHLHSSGARNRVVVPFLNVYGAQESIPRNGILQLR